MGLPKHVNWGWPGPRYIVAILLMLAFAVLFLVNDVRVMSRLREDRSSLPTTRSN